MSGTSLDIEYLINTELVPTLQDCGFNSPQNSFSDACWTFRGEHYQIALWWDSRGELAFRISNLQGNEWVPLWMALSQSDPDWAFAASIMLNANAPERSVLALQRLARLLHRHREILTTPNELLLPQLLLQQRTLASEYTKDMHLADALRKAAKLWQSKKYQDFISELSHWEDDLSPAMNAKLQFARKRATE